MAIRAPDGANNDKTTISNDSNDTRIYLHFAKIQKNRY